MQISDRCKIDSFDKCQKKTGTPNVPVKVVKFNILKLFWVKHYPIFEARHQRFQMPFFHLRGLHYFQSVRRRRRGKGHIFVFDHVFNTGIG